VTWTTSSHTSWALVEVINQLNKSINSFLLLAVIIVVSIIILLVVNNVRHLYTEWEEFPSQLIVRSKNKVTFLPSNHSGITAISDMRNDDTLPATPSSNPQESRRCEVPSTSHSEQKTRKKADKGNKTSATKSFRGNLSLSLGLSNSNNNPAKPHFTRLKKSYPHDLDERSSREEQREKYSPEELKVIQERVKSSLERQGVFLYDPVTGAGKA